MLSQHIRDFGLQSVPIFDLVLFSKMSDTKTDFCIQNVIFRKLCKKRSLSKSEGHVSSAPLYEKRKIFSYIFFPEKITKEKNYFEKSSSNLKPTPYFIFFLMISGMAKILSYLNIFTNPRMKYEFWD